MLVHHCYLSLKPGSPDCRPHLPAILHLDLLDPLPCPLQKPQGGAYARETPPVPGWFVCPELPSKGRAAGPLCIFSKARTLTLCPIGPRVGPFHMPLGRMAGPVLVINSGRDDQKPFLELTLSKPEGVNTELPARSSPQHSPRQCVRIPSRRKQNRKFREETEPWVPQSNLGLGLCTEAAPCLGSPGARGNTSLWAVSSERWVAATDH